MQDIRPVAVHAGLCQGRPLHHRLLRDSPEDLHSGGMCLSHAALCSTAAHRACAEPVVCAELDLGRCSSSGTGRLCAGSRRNRRCCCQSCLLPGPLVCCCGGLRRGRLLLSLLRLGRRWSGRSRLLALVRASGWSWSPGTEHRKSLVECSLGLRRDRRRSWSLAHTRACCWSRWLGLLLGPCPGRTRRCHRILCPPHPFPHASLEERIDLASWEHVVPLSPLLFHLPPLLLHLVPHLPLGSGGLLPQRLAFRVRTSHDGLQLGDVIFVGRGGWEDRNCRSGHHRSRHAPWRSPPSVLHSRRHHGMAWHSWSSGPHHGLHGLDGSTLYSWDHHPRHGPDRLRDVQWGLWCSLQRGWLNGYGSVPSAASGGLDCSTCRRVGSTWSHARHLGKDVRCLCSHTVDLSRCHSVLFCLERMVDRDRYHWRVKIMEMSGP